MEWALKMRHHTDKERFKAALDCLQANYSLSKVPCKETLISSQCPFPDTCMYDHSGTFFRQYPCPLASNCWRGELCLYTHTPKAVLARQTLIIRSQSLLRQLEAQILSFVSIVSKYQAQIESLYPYEVSLTTQKQWVFDDRSNPLPVAFEPQAQADIQYAVDHHKSFALINGFKVFFKPQFLITSDERVHRVACTSVCTGSSQAGVLTFLCEESWAEAFMQEIRQLECEVPGVVVGNKQLSWMKQWGLALEAGQIIGEREMLAQALREKPDFDDYDDILETPFPFDPTIHSISGRTVEVFSGKIVGLRDDVIKVCTMTNAASRPANPSMFALNSLPAPMQMLAQSNQAFCPPRLEPLAASISSAVPFVQSSARRRAPSPAIVRTPAKPSSRSIREKRHDASDDREIERIRELVQEMLPAANSIEVQRANANISAVRRYERRKREMSLFGTVLTKQLFHGTKHVRPQDIITSEECLNARRQGPRGKKGIYFYESLAAIENYSHRNAQDRKQTLLCL